MTPEDRALAERVHVTVTAAAPDLGRGPGTACPPTRTPTARSSSHSNSGKFNLRYSTLEFQDAANLDDGDVWPVS